MGDLDIITSKISFCTFLECTNRAINHYIWRNIIPNKGPLVFYDNDNDNDYVFIAM